MKKKESIWKPILIQFAIVSVVFFVIFALVSFFTDNTKEEYAQKEDTKPISTISVVENEDMKLKNGFAHVDYKIMDTDSFTLTLINKKTNEENVLLKDSTSLNGKLIIERMEAGTYELAVSGGHLQATVIQDAPKNLPALESKTFTLQGPDTTFVFVDGGMYDFEFKQKTEGTGRILLSNGAKNVVLYEGKQIGEQISDFQIRDRGDYALVSTGDAEVEITVTLRK